MRREKQETTPAAPTRIVKKPYLADVAGYKRQVMVCECDDGKTYTFYALAKIIGIVYGSLIQRLRVYSWESPLILMPKSSPGLAIDGGPMRDTSGKSGNAAWRGLSNKPRGGVLLLG